MPTHQVKRASDIAVKDNTPVFAGNVTNEATQDTFCAGATWVISFIYGRSGHGNVLTRAAPGGFKNPVANDYENLASITATTRDLNGQKVYGVYIAPGTDYYNDKITDWHSKRRHSGGFMRYSR
ncbi:hypothetical protein MMC25_000568 [Agyrium rufum]|nr:hypothetical protein [Agyrium rufum]